MNSPPRLYLAILLAVAVGLPAGCEQRESDATVRVFGASSLTEVLGDLETEFESSHAGANVDVTVSGSQVLRLQIEEGARANLFVSADRRHAESLVEQGLGSDLRVVARNELCIGAGADSPVSSFEQLPQAQTLVMGADSVPVGAYTDEMLERAEREYGGEFAETIRERVVSREMNVRLVRAKVALGEADAAIVYCTDLRGVPGVTRIEIPESVNVRTEYVMVTVGQSTPAVEAFRTFLGGPAGAEILSRRGYLTGR